MATMAEAAQQATGERELAARLRKVNLDLLPVLHELLRTRSVTRTAQSFNMTQPAVSRALRQLRGAFDDQLLVSLRPQCAPYRPGRDAGRAARPHAGRPRPAAEACRAVRSGDRGGASGDQHRRLCHPAPGADPDRICAREAPHVVLEFTWAATRNAEDLAKVDFMIGPRAFGQTLGKRVGSLPLWRDEMVCVAAAANRAVPARLTPAQFQAMRYVAFRRGLHVPQDVQSPAAADLAARGGAGLHRSQLPGAGRDRRAVRLHRARAAQGGARARARRAAAHRRDRLSAQAALHRRLLEPRHQQPPRPRLVPRRWLARGAAAVARLACL